MAENQLGRGRVIEYDTSLEPGFVRDEELNIQLSFYYRQGRFLIPYYVEGEPSFSQTNETVEFGRTFQLRKPYVGDELVYHLVGHGALAHIVHWAYASNYDELRLSTEKPV